MASSHRGERPRWSPTPHRGAGVRRPPRWTVWCSAASATTEHRLPANPANPAKHAELGACHRARPRGPAGQGFGRRADRHGPSAAGRARRRAW